VLRVHLDNVAVVSFDNKQPGSSNARQCRPGQIGPAPSGDDRTDGVGMQSDRHKRGGGAGAGAKITDPKMRRIYRLGEPVGRAHEPLGEQLYIEANRAVCRPVSRRSRNNPGQGSTELPFISNSPGWGP
jgi:hypothetical protein